MGWFSSFTRALTAAATLGASEAGRAVAKKTGSAELGLLTGGTLNPTGITQAETTGGLAGAGVVNDLLKVAAESGANGAIPTGLKTGGVTDKIVAAEDDLRRRTRTLLTGGQGDESQAPTYAPLLGGFSGLLGGARAVIGRIRPTRY